MNYDLGVASLRRTASSRTSGLGDWCSEGLQTALNVEMCMLQHRSLRARRRPSLRPAQNSAMLTARRSKATARPQLSARRRRSLIIWALRWTFSKPSLIHCVRQIEERSLC